MARLTQRDVWIAAYKTSWFATNSEMFMTMSKATKIAIEKWLDIAANEYYTVWVREKRPTEGLTLPDGSRQGSSEVNGS